MKSGGVTEEPPRERGGLKLHWIILICMGAGIAVGAILQTVFPGPGWIGITGENHIDGVQVASIQQDLLPKGRKSVEALVEGDILTALVLNRGVPDRERRIPIETVEGLEATLAEVGYGMVASLDLAVGGPRSVLVRLDPASDRNAWIEPFRFVADLFMRLLKMLIVPIVLTSIITGVTGLGSGSDFGRLGRRTLTYYICTSLLAATLGLILVNLIRPGVGAELGLASFDPGTEKENLWEIFKRMVPENVFSAFNDNAKMLQIIFFALLFGYFITRASEPSRKVMTDFFEAAFEVVMRLARAVMLTVPVGVFCLLVKVVGETGFSVFAPLGWYMLTVFLALVLHACGTLPTLLWVLGRVNPFRWAHAMSPALMTAFSTSSSSMTLPVTLETVEERGKVSNKVTSFVAPLGSTVNMDGTALYECIGVVFLAQYYASTNPEVTLTLSTQVYVVIAALMASIGAAGIPSAGLVMMLTILSALELPLEGAALLLAVDRPLDMCRTVVNVWSDTCGSAVIAAREGERPLIGGGPPEAASLVVEGA